MDHGLEINMRMNISFKFRQRIHCSPFIEWCHSYHNTMDYSCWVYGGKMHMQMQSSHPGAASCGHHELRERDRSRGRDRDRSRDRSRAQSSAHFLPTSSRTMELKNSSVSHQPQWAGETKQNHFTRSADTQHPTQVHWFMTWLVMMLIKFTKSKSI